MIQTTQASIVRAELSSRGSPGRPQLSSARAKSSASNGRRSSSCSPIADQLHRDARARGRSPARCRPSRCRRAWSARCRSTVDRLARTARPGAGRSGPVVASTVSSVSCGAPGSCLAITRAHLARARPSGRPGCAGARRCRRSPRPRRARAPVATASKATGAGIGVGLRRVTKSAPARWAHSSSCSTAAARNVSAAPITTVPAQLLAQMPGELADRRRLARAVDADGEDHRRLGAQVDPVGVVVAGARELGQQLGQPRRERLAVLQRRPPPPRAPGARRPPPWCARPTSA